MARVSGTAGTGCRPRPAARFFFAVVSGSVMVVSGSVIVFGVSFRFPFET